MLKMKAFLLAGAIFTLPQAAQATGRAPEFEVIDYEYQGDCDPSFVKPSISPDGTFLEVPFEGSGFEAIASAFEGPHRVKAECVVFVTVSIPRGWEIAPHFIDIVGVADLDRDGRGVISAQYRFLEGAQSPVAAEAYVGPFVGGIRVQSPRVNGNGIHETNWSGCRQGEVTFRVSSSATSKLRGRAEFAELDMTNGVGNNLACGFFARRC